MAEIVQLLYERTQRFRDAANGLWQRIIDLEMVGALCEECNIERICSRRSRVVCV